MTQTQTDTTEDVVELLLKQHQQVKQLFDDIPLAVGDRKEELFHELVRLLAIHESAEEQVIHPAARKVAGDDIVDARLREEDEAKHTLAELDKMGVESPEFTSRLAEFALDVIAHATHEENDEFPALRSQKTPEELHRLAGAVRAAEAIAPTRPHPAAGESPVANAVAGPALAAFDKARDAVRDWNKTQSPG